MDNGRGLLIILSSPSGAGKSTLSKRLMTWDPSMSFSVSATTRPPRKGEVNGIDYYFETKDDFANLVENDQMLEYAEVFENSYGSPKGPVEEAIDAGRDVLFDIDWQGGQQVRASSLKDHVLSIFILPPSIIELERRLKTRGQDSDEVIAKRMEKSRDEISHWVEYDYVLINDDLDQTEDRLKSIVTSERMRKSQQPWLMDHIRKLNSEFEER